MKDLAILFFLFLFAFTAFGQPPKTTSKKLPRPAKTVAVQPGSETEEFEKAKALTEPTGRIAALQNFIKNFPESTELSRAQGLIVGARAELADKKLEAGETEAGIELFKLAVREAPSPVSDELFTKVILGFPISLYSRDQRGAAFDIVQLIEEKVGANASQILDLSKFYINVQYGTEAIRLAKKATELAPDSATGFLTLAIANRLNFQLEDAANAYARAAELDGESVTNKRSLAEMKRALGKNDEAMAIYRQLLEKDPSDAAAQTGLTLALFGAEKVKEAEAELIRSLETNPDNTALLVGAAYWYAAHNKGAKAVEYSQKAIAVDRSFVWAYIAQARGLLAENKPLEAEKILLAARQFGDFPTLDYELASARLAAGLYREAAETLKRNFKVKDDGAVETYLGNRILADAGSFTELLSLERRVALFETKAADNEETTNKLKSLLLFNQKLEAAGATEEELARAAEEFAKGGDNMRLHRQLFAASRLLQKKTALPKVLELMQAAVGSVDGALNVPSPSASVLADEIYESRQYAISQNLVVVVPEIPRQTLSAILRGRIEDIAGLALFQQNDVSQSIVRLKRALSVLPDKSAWSRASAWHLGEVLQADGKETEALEAFLKAYDKDFPVPEKRAFIEDLYVKVNGNADGLEERIGVKPETTVAATETKTPFNNTDNVRTIEPRPFRPIQPEPARVPVADETPQTADVKPAPEPSPKTEETTETKAETQIETKPETTPETALPENQPAVTPEQTPEVSPLPENADVDESDLKIEPSPAPEETPETVEEKPDETKPVEVKTEEISPEVTKAEEISAEETKPEEADSDPLPVPDETPTTQDRPLPETVPSPETSSEEKRTEEIEPEETKPDEERTEEAKPEEINAEETKPEEIKPADPKPAEPKPRATPATQNISVVITDTTAQVIPPRPKAEPSKTANKPARSGRQDPSKPLFEPVIISIGKTETSNPQRTEPTLSPEKPADEQKTPADEQPLEIIQNPSLTPNPKTQPKAKPADESILTGENRPRIIITENTGAKTLTEEISSCKLVVSPDSLSLLNGGGSLGVTVEFEGEGDFRQIRAASSSAEDVEVRRDPEVGAAQNRAFFIIKSVSTRTGVFTLTFTAPCGRKEILVKVR